MELEKKLEAILFWRAEPISRKRLGEILNVKSIELNESIEKLKNNLTERGIVLLEKDDDLTLGTHPDFSKLIENLQKEELNRELSRASLETLSIILYKGSTSRSVIDYIRGVNSSFILRALSVRGLLERIADPKDARRYLYRPSFDLLSYMGVKRVEELPDFEEVNNLIKGAERSAEEVKDE